MILLLGATGYIGDAFARELTSRKEPFKTLSRKQVDYSRFEALLQYLQKERPSFVVNAAGYTGKPNVDACEIARADTLQGNTLLPQTIAQACAASGTPWGHVSSGCIFSGAKVRENGKIRVEKELMDPGVKELITKDPSAVIGFAEDDEPNFSFRDMPCSFYSGTKALAEEAIRGVGQSYIWRLRIPFDEFDSSRNYLSKVQRYAKVYDNLNAISHRGDFVKACLDLWKLRAPFGTYNVTNPGYLSTREVVQAIERILKPNRKFEYWSGNDEFYRIGAKTPRSNCVLDASKMLNAGVKIRPVMEAVEDSLNRWQPERA
ncbi:MAG: dTDP-4-dehydrorhamnose reductase [Pedosphaera sp.]|nr:dTDP-4-dehydrorhamnose reductase [Pedosphaera sp.]